MCRFASSTKLEFKLFKPTYLQKKSRESFFYRNRPCNGKIFSTPLGIKNFQMKINQNGDTFNYKVFSSWYLSFNWYQANFPPSQASLPLWLTNLTLTKRALGWNAANCVNYPLTEFSWKIVFFFETRNVLWSRLTFQFPSRRDSLSMNKTLAAKKCSALRALVTNVLYDLLSVSNNWLRSFVKNSFLSAILFIR